MKMLVAVLVVSVGLFTLGPARATEPPTAPVLRIEAGMHTAMIWRASADEAGRLALTVSQDKTARLWELPSGRLLRVLRPPLGDGSEGLLFCGAVSPDGRLAAVAGWTGWDWEGKANVYLFDTASGRLVRRLSGLPQMTQDLAFSASGRWLAAGLGEGGIRLWEVASGYQAGRDPEYGSRCNGLDWQGDERLVSTCLDGKVRLYSWRQEPPAKLRPSRSTALKQGKRPFAARFSPDGRRIAVTFHDTTALAVLAASDLSLLFAPETAGVDNGNFASVAWSADGATLAAGGMWFKDGGCPLRLWSDAGRGRSRDVVVATNTLMDLRPLPGGALLFGAQDPMFGILSEAGTVSKLGASPIVPWEHTFGSFRLSDDGSTVSFAWNEQSSECAVLTISDRRLQARVEQTLFDRLNPPRITGAKLSEWCSAGNAQAVTRALAQGCTRADLGAADGRTPPKLKGQPLKLEAYEISRSLAVSPDASFFLLGTEWGLRCFSAKGTERWKVRAPGAVTCVNVSADGQLAVAAYADGTIRWHRADTGQELLAFFPHADQERWVLWTPQGYYDASPKGEELIGWHVNRGKEQAADFFPAAKFRDQFYRPDVISRVLETRDVAAAVKVANGAAGRRTTEAAPAQAVIGKMAPPVVELAVGGALAEATVPAGAESFTVRYRVRRSGSEPVTRVRLLIDGRPVPAEAPIPASNTAEASASVPLPAKDCVLAVLAENKFAVSEPATLRLVRTGTPSPPASESQPAALKPKLYLLAAGITIYKNNDQLENLHFAAKDAQDFAAAFRRQEGGLYQKVDAKVLTDKDATASDIRDGLDWIKQQTTAKDVAVIFFSGHGENDEELRYFFCAQDYDKGRRLRTGVSIADIQSTLRSIPGKVLFFIDSCHAGNALGKLFAAKSTGAQVDVTRLVNELADAENGAIVFTSSTGRQLSLELSQDKNGAFTKAIVEGLDGKADLLRSGKITVSTLEAFVAERVKELTEGQQTPTVAKPQTVPDFPIALKR